MLKNNFSDPSLENLSTENFQIIEIIINDQQAGIRLDRLLAEREEFSSRSRVAQLFASKRILVNDKAVKPSYIPTIGNKVKVFLPSPLSSSDNIVPYDFPLSILFEDNDVLVVNKPAGIVVHPSHGHEKDTLVNALVHHTKNLSMGFHEKRPGIVHRLDKDTSGILVVAKHDQAHTFLARQFREKTVHRIYWAVVFGTPTESKKTLSSHLIRDPQDRKRFVSVEKKLHRQLDRSLPLLEAPVRGKYAITHYRLLKSSNHQQLSLLECRLETGRTHQIRIHLSEMGNPILGDKIYGSNQRSRHISSLPLRQSISKMNRIALHARELSFVHPRSKKLLSFQVDWPEDLKELFYYIGLI